MDLYGIDSTGKREFPRPHACNRLDKNVWFTNILENKLGKWDPETKKDNIVGGSKSECLSIRRRQWTRTIALGWLEWIRCKFAKFDPTTEKFLQNTPQLK